MYACYIYADVDECIDDIHDCSQNCHNTVGSYTCSCNDGFVIDSDSRGCNGITYSYSYVYIDFTYFISLKILMSVH